MTEIARRARDVMAARLGPKAAEASDDARFVEDLHATSIDQVELIMSIEDAFEIEISDSDAEKIHTVGDLVSFVRGQVGQGHGAPAP